MPYWFTRLVGLLLRDWRFRVHMGDDTSARRPQHNGLPQGSVLAPVLFNLYSNNLPVTCGRKFIYADGICLAIQGQFFSELECSLSLDDMARMSHFCRQLRLKPSASKTISSVFHLHNTSTARELSVYLDGLRLRHECHPTYLGVTLDRRLSYREHLTKTAGKLIPTVKCKDQMIPVAGEFLLCISIKLKTIKTWSRCPTDIETLSLDNTFSIV